MSAVSKKLFNALLLASVAIALPITVASPAHADRCQPEELVLGAGNSPMPESANPACGVLINIVYPAAGCGGTGTLVDCINRRTPAPVPDVFNPIPPLGPVPFAGTYIGDGTTGVTVLGQTGAVCVDYYLLLPNYVCVVQY